MSEPARQQQAESIFDKIIDPVLITTYLRRLYDVRAFLTVILPGSSTLYNSMLIEVNPKEGYLLMDQINSDKGHKKLLESGKFRIHTMHRGVEINFNCKLASVLHENIGDLYKLVMPKLLYYHQRRQNYRAHVSMSYAVRVLLELHDETSMEGWLANISSGGIGIQINKDLWVPLETGMRIEKCTFDIPDDIEIHCELTVRNVHKDGNAYMHLGGQFVNLERDQTRAIGRFVTWLDRELIKKMPRDD